MVGMGQKDSYVGYVEVMYSLVNRGMTMLNFSHPQ
jgi:hypothetical protein